VLQTCQKIVEHTVICFTLEEDLDLRHARWLRGAIGRQTNRPEFHHHLGRGLIFQHPLIRYYVKDNRAFILGMAEGAFLLRGLPPLDTLSLGGREYRIVDASIETTRIELGPCEQPLIYHFVTPYLALNQMNHDQWHCGDPFARRRLLQRIVVGNLLSLGKAVDLHIADRLHAEVDLVPDQHYELKPGLSLLGFRGAIQVNFELPEFWGIGKSSARGFGTLLREEV